MLVTVKSCQHTSQRCPSNTARRQALHYLACRHNLSFSSSASSDCETLKLEKIRTLMSIRRLRWQPSPTFQDSRHSESMFKTYKRSTMHIHETIATHPSE